MEILRIVLEMVWEILGDPIWQGVGVIIALLLGLAHLLPQKAKLFAYSSVIIVIVVTILLLVKVGPSPGNSGQPVTPTVLTATPTIPASPPPPQYTSVQPVTPSALNDTPTEPALLVSYFQKPWSNNTGRTFLYIDKVTLEDNIITFYFTLVNTKETYLNFDQGVSCDGTSTTCMYVSDEKQRKYFYASKGGDLFDGNGLISIPGGSSKSGWVRYILSNDIRNYISLHRSAEDNTGRNTIYIQYKEFRCQYRPFYCYEP